MSRRTLRLCLYAAILAGATAQLALAHSDPITWHSYVDLGIIVGVIWMIVAEVTSTAGSR